MSVNIHTILVANRGEIARRVFRTAREMGIRCVAVYTDADTDALFVAEADEAIRLDDSYLDGTAIIAAASATGAQAVHPGYGFLSENASFAADVIRAGLIWIGPTPEVISTMGDKLAAKRAATKAGVASLPSSDDPTDAGDVGFPLLVKAAAGGGGKGMRLVETADELVDSVAQARREASSAFGDDTVFLERYVAQSRHIEIQILGDSHGNLVHLGERECSIQRRHQKIIEESPSPVVDSDLRARMGAAALDLASTIGYQSAGTVEFLLDSSDGEYYFLETNTRLQVEHPVTEMVTGIDLVREQIRIAAGEPLGYQQDAVTFTGHAIEARLYAEDPANGYLPAIGTLRAYQPAAAPSVRWDTGVAEGSVVGVEFDPMLAKAIASAPSRPEAAARLALALERFHLGGVVTNRDLLASVLRSPEFCAGSTTTDFLDRVKLPGQFSRTPFEIEHAAVAASMWLQASRRDQTDVLPNVRSGFVLGRIPPQSVTWLTNGDELTVQYRSRRDGHFVLGAAGEGGEVTIHDWHPDRIDVECLGSRRRYRVSQHNEVVYLTAGHGTLTLEAAPRFAVPEGDAPTGGLSAPMPGVILEVRAKPGDDVTAGQTLVVLEAMKMEHHMNAPIDGVIAEVRVAEGDQVDNSELLILFESNTDEMS